MASMSLETAIRRAGSPVELLRQSPARPFAFPVAPEFTNWRSEQQAWRSSCVLFDQSHHMTDFFLRGPGALELLSRFGVNTFAGFTPGKAKQYVAASPDGYFIGDAICFHLDDELFDVVGHATVINWLQYNAETGGYDVTFERDNDSANRASGPPKLYRYELQGPAAGPLTAKLTGAPLPDVKFFNMTEFTIAGHRVRALRHGMAGQPGFELFGPWAQGDDVLGAILAAGAEFGLVPGRREGLLHGEPRVRLDPGRGAGDLRPGDDRLPGMAGRHRARLARRQHGLPRHHRLLRHPVRPGLRPHRAVRPRLLRRRRAPAHRGRLLPEEGDARVEPG